MEIWTVSESWSGVMIDPGNLGHSLMYLWDNAGLDLESDDIDYGGHGTETEVETGRVDDWLRIHGFAIGGCWIDRAGVSEVVIGECGRLSESVRARI